MLLIPLLSFYLSKPQEKRHDRRLIGKSTQQRHRVLLHRTAKTKGETEEEGLARATHRPHMVQWDMNCSLYELEGLDLKTHTHIHTQPPSWPFRVSEGCQEMQVNRMKCFSHIHADIDDNCWPDSCLEWCARYKG